MKRKLSPEAVREKLERLSGWREVSGRDAIRKTYQFQNFSEALGFVVRVGLMAEKLDHHPEWSNAYGRVEIVLTTHDAQGVTELDFALAVAADQAAGRGGG